MWGCRPSQAMVLVSRASLNLAVAPASPDGRAFLIVGEDGKEVGEYRETRIGNSRPQAGADAFFSLGFDA